MLSSQRSDITSKGSPSIASLTFQKQKSIETLWLTWKQNLLVVDFVFAVYFFIYQQIHLTSVLTIQFNSKLFSAILNIVQIFMLIQNSSKSYPQIYSWENKPCASIEVQIRSQAVILTSKDFFQLTQLIQMTSIPEIKNLGLQFLLINQNSSLITHILVYYCLKVNLKIEIQGLQSYYLKELGNLYVASKFNIQIGKYSKICEIYTGINIRKCAHIIYYLIYGRLATNSYIETIILQLTPQADKKEKHKTIFSQNHLPRKELVGREKQQENQENACEDLIQELQNIFQKSNPNQKKCSKLVNYSNKQEICEEVEDQTKDREDVNLMGDSQKKYYMSFFPNRIFNDEKSAIFERMHPNCRSNYKLMRKKRFNDAKIEKMLYTTFNIGEERIKTGQNQNDKVQCIKERSKLFTNSSIKTNEKFKNVSHELDKIRTVITKGKKRSQIHYQTGDVNQAMNEKERQYLELREKIGKEQPQLRTAMNQSNKTEYDCNNKIVSLIRKQKNGSRTKKGYEQSFSRKNGESQRMIFGNLGNLNERGNINRMFHSDCQNRLFQYKNEYRKFMKVHFFVIQDD